MRNKKIEKLSLISLSLLIVISYILGFILNENSAGGGVNDSEHIWSNLQIFLLHDLKSAILHDNYYDSRSPAVYILHKYFNPFTDTFLNYRISVFFLSFLVPIFFFYSLKQEVFNKKKGILTINSFFDFS